MRIAIINNFPHITGGADRHCLDLSAILTSQGHEVNFLTTAGAARLPGVTIPPTVTRATRDAIPIWSRATVATRALWNRSAFVAAKALLYHFEPDVVHAHKLYPQLSVAPIIAAKQEGVPVVQTLHDYEFLSASAEDHTGGWVDRKESRLDYQALNTVLLGAKRIYHVPAVDEWIAVSRAVAKTYDAFGIRATTIPNFTLRGTGTVPDQAPRSGVIYVGRLTADKGVFDLFDVAELLPTITIRIAGRGPLETVVHEAAHRIPNLAYLGVLEGDEVMRQLRSSQLAVLPSRWQEPGPLACLEAMAAGTPVVAYRGGGLAEYIEDANAGLVVPMNPRALADACSVVISNTSMWQSLSANATRAIDTTHSAREYLPALLRIYERAARVST